LQPYAGAWQVDGGGDLVVAAERERLVVETASREAFGRLYSSRVFDAARARRLEKLMEGILAGVTAGDFGAMARARGDAVPAERLAAGQAEWTADQETRLGALGTGHRVVGAAFQEGRDVVVVRYQFARGTADRAYVFDPDEEGRLLGISSRGLDPRLGFVPTGDASFGSWDGGHTASRAMTVTREADGRWRMEVGAGPNRIVAHH